MTTQLIGFGRRLREARETKGLNQPDFAELGGKQKNSQVQYEAGKGAPSIEYLYRLAEHGIDIGWLLTGRSIEAPGLSDQEQKLLQLFGKLSARERAAVIALIRGLAGLEETSFAALVAKKAAGIE